ncbi:hypothetical protein ACJX0J_020345, partial [Zea mays]
ITASAATLFLQSKTIVITLICDWYEINGLMASLSHFLLKAINNTHNHGDPTILTIERSYNLEGNR